MARTTLSGIRMRLRALRVPTLAKLTRLPSVLKGRERLTFITGVFVLILGGTLAVTGWYWGATTVVPAVGGTYIEGLLGAPRFVNPLFASANDVDRDIVQLVYAGLFRADASGAIVPELASGYTTSDDGTEITVELREDARWHDGALVTADDVLFTVRLLQHSDVASPLRGSFRGVEAVRIDDRTVRFTIERPLAIFLSALTVGLLPEHRWIDIPPAHLPLAELNLRPIGAGPYRFMGLTKDPQGMIRSYALNRYDGYHAGAAYLEHITFKFYEREDALQAAFATREVDGIGTLLPLREDVPKRSDAVVRTVQLPQTTAVFLNAKRSTALTEIRVREALSLVIDRTAFIAETLHGAGTPIGGPIIPGFATTANPPAPDAVDPDAAAALLDRAGWKRTETEETIALRTKQLLLELEIAKKKEGKKTAELSATDEERAKVTEQVQAEIAPEQPYYRLSSGQPLTIELVTPNAPELIGMAEFIRRAWQQIGVTVTLSVMPLDRVRGEVIPNREYDALLFSQILGPDPDPFPFWHSSQVRHPGLNLSYFSNKEIDKLLEDARAMFDHEERGRAYAEFQERLHAVRPAIFLVTPTLSYPMVDTVRGVELGQLTQPADRFATVTEWYTETERRWRTSD
ncbi:MAG: peptide ABC transporter substrate-binding protein [bacterium]|nr:peptide ABC transporter substrate-binding protein [bacterium]